jgi:hypothetical protein
MKVVKLFAFAICAAVSASHASAQTSPEDPGQGKTEPAKGNAVGQSVLTGRASTRGANIVRTSPVV